MLIQLRHLGMAQRREQTRLAIERRGSLDNLFCTQLTQGDLFDSHIALGLDVTRAIHGARAARAEDGPQLITSMEERPILPVRVLDGGCQELSTGKAMRLFWPIGHAACQAEMC